MLDHRMQPPSLDQSSATPNERVAPPPSSEAVPQEILGNALILERATPQRSHFHGEEPHHEEVSIDPSLRQAVPSLFQQGIIAGPQAYRAHDLPSNQDEDTGDDHPTEEALIHFFAGQVSAKAYKRALVPVSYPYRIGFALGQLNGAVATMGTWPVVRSPAGHVVPPPAEHDKAEEGRMA